MAIPDISELHGQELMELIEQANQQYMQERSNTQTNLVSARAALGSLIGPDSPTSPSMTSLTEVQLYTDAQIVRNAALAVRLALKATEQVARTLRDVLMLVR